LNPSGLFLTEDGSNSIYSDKYEVAYHSIHGAIGETQHVFIDAGLHDKRSADTLNVLDIGFGTGLNTLMTYLESDKSSAKIHYETVEAYPISIDIAKEFNYPNQLGCGANVFLQLHSLSWNVLHSISKKFTFFKHLAKFEEFKSEHVFDVIYYDAFAPSAQPTLWEPSILEKMFMLTKPNGILVTYCAQGQFKRNLKSVGYSLESLPGPPGKREMTRARKIRKVKI